VWTADIDVGGTLTDGVFTDGENVVSVKVDTTPHDLTVCLFDCLAQGAEKLAFTDTIEFLEHIELIRWSTTITSNVLAESRGPRIGLLVSQGHEKDLYGRPARSVVFDRVLAERDVIGLDGSADETEIMNAARTLLESGVRRICVSLKDAHHHPEREASIKRAIGEQYPDHFLGSVPVLAGSDISQSADDQTRTHCALINAYTHGALAATLFKAEDELRETSRYTGAFLVSHINGGVAGISKTRAIDTIESGPILGIQGSAFMAKAYGLKDVIAMDIGGTTAKVSLLRGGEPVYRKPSDFFGIPVEISLPDLHAIALGGGSVVKPVSHAQQPAIELGPESMGAYPGPACYGLGGDQPTLTDASVAAGLINPDYFQGGTKPIDRELAWQIIQEMIAKPLHISTEEACRAIINRAFELVADLLITTCGMWNADLVTPSLSNPQSAIRNPQSECTLFAYGGNGGLFACGVAEKAGLDRVQVLSLGPVFSAFGSSVSDISHVYERSLPGVAISDDAITQVRQIVEEMKAEAVKDMLGEGVRPHDVTYTTEIEDLIRVRAKKAMPKPKLAQRPLQGEDCSHARTGTRQVFWGSSSGQAQIYRWESLQPGNRVEGCAVLEGANTTYFIPDGWVMVVDGFGNGALSRRSEQGP
jgi:N-methylhydantoinase A/oxoprolinase/acetone carboxylase beta subunit